MQCFWLVSHLGLTKTRVSLLQDTSSKLFSAFVSTWGGECSVTGSTPQRRPTRFSRQKCKCTHVVFCICFLYLVFKVSARSSSTSTRMRHLCVAEISPLAVSPHPRCVIHHRRWCRGRPAPRHCPVTSRDTVVSLHQTHLCRHPRCHCTVLTDATASSKKDVVVALLEQEKRSRCCRFFQVCTWSAVG